MAGARYHLPRAARVRLFGTCLLGGTQKRFHAKIAKKREARKALFLNHTLKSLRIFEI
jgi:hypothetical protein